MDQVLSYLGEHSWIVEVFFIVLATGAVGFIAKVALDRLARHLDRTHNVFDDAFLEAARRPLAVGIWVVGISWAAEAVGGAAQAEIFQYVGNAREVAVVWVLVWFAIRFIRFVEEHLVENGYRAEPVDATTASAVGKLLRATVMITGVLLVLQAFGFSISGVLAFGGIGGIAVGFAARDLLANFFGALMIFMDRPFAVGDWIRSPDQEIEGTVEDIGWRLTRIRTFDKRPIYVPNSIFNSITVENPSRMYNRRIKETIGIRYQDIGAMDAITSDVKSMLESHEAIDASQTLMVNFDAFGPSSVDFFIYTFTKTIVWTEFHEIKQDILLRIARIIDAHGAEIAFPTRTLHIEAEPEASAEPEAEAQAG